MSVKYRYKLLFLICDVIYIEDICDELWSRLVSDDTACVLNWLDF